MNEKKIVNFLVNGFQVREDRDEETMMEEPVEGPEADAAVEEETYGEEYIEEPVEPAAMDMTGLEDELRAVKDELLKMRYILEDLRDVDPHEPAAPAPELPNMSAYLTTRDQMKAVTAAVERREADASNKAMVKSMEQIAIMREDFFKLCQGMRARIDTMSAESVLSSFEAYSVDMENILRDGGVFIGAFDYDKLNTLHQRIIGVIPTDDEEKNGMIAERLSDGYKIGNRVLLKEKVKIYKFTEAAKASETDSETCLKTDSEPEAKIEIQEEEE